MKGHRGNARKTLLLACCSSRRCILRGGLAEDKVTETFPRSASGSFSSHRHSRLRAVDFSQSIFRSITRAYALSQHHAQPSATSTAGLAIPLPA